MEVRGRGEVAVQGMKSHVEGRGVVRWEMDSKSQPGGEWGL